MPMPVTITFTVDAATHSALTELISELELENTNLDDFAQSLIYALTVDPTLPIGVTTFARGFTRSLLPQV